MKVEQFIKLKLYNELTVDDYIDIHNKNPNLILDIIKKMMLLKKKLLLTVKNTLQLHIKKKVYFYFKTINFKLH